MRASITRLHDRQVRRRVTTKRNRRDCRFLGWRPAFRYYNQWVALFGVLISVLVGGWLAASLLACCTPSHHFQIMFIVSWLSALLTFFFFALLYFYIKYRKLGKRERRQATAHSQKRECDC